MSRSRKKHPFGWVSGGSAGAMKLWKKLCNRSLRRNKNFAEGPPSYYKKANGARADIWLSPSDGKMQYDLKSEKKPWKLIGK